jgi:hypothetical protein
MGYGNSRCARSFAERDCSCADGLTLAMSMFAFSTEEAGDYREDSRERFFMNSGVSPSAVGAQRHSVSPGRELEIDLCSSCLHLVRDGKGCQNNQLLIERLCAPRKVGLHIRSFSEGTPASSAPQKYEPQVRGIRSNGP